MTKTKLWAEIKRQTPDIEKDGIPGDRVRKFFDLVYGHAYTEGNKAALRDTRRSGDTEFLESVLGLFKTDGSRKKWPGTGL